MNLEGISGCSGKGPHDERKRRREQDRAFLNPFALRGARIEGVYAATKAGIVLAAKGVHVNAVTPGVVDTPLTASIKNNPDWYSTYAQRRAAGRAKVKMAGLIAFLAFLREQLT